MREIARYRYLFEQMVRRELRQKYQGSALGVAWYLVNPLVLMGAYYLMFGVLLARWARSSDYPLFLMVGIVVWIFFRQSLLSAAPVAARPGLADPQGARSRARRSRLPW